MPHFMIMASYQPESLKEMLLNPDALKAREDHAEKFYGALGGKVVQSYFLRDAQYHFMVVVDFPDSEAAHAAVMIGSGSGAFKDGLLYELATMEEAFSAVQRASAGAKVFFAPGGAPGDFVKDK